MKQLLFPTSMEVGLSHFSVMRRKPVKYNGCAAELKVIVLREAPIPHPVCDTAGKIFEAWQSIVPRADWFDPLKECLVAFFLSTRRRLEGFQLIAMGTLDTVLLHPREIFRPAIAAGASAIVICHNHPSGDPTPSEADVKMTREVIRAANMIKIDLLDHLVIGKQGEPFGKGYLSLRELGYFYTS